MLDPEKIAALINQYGADGLCDRCRSAGWNKCLTTALRQIAGLAEKAGPRGLNFDSACFIADAAGITVDSLRLGEAFQAARPAVGPRLWSGAAMRRLRGPRPLSWLRDQCKAAGWQTCMAETLRRIESASVGTRFGCACYVADALGVRLEDLRAAP